MALEQARTLPPLDRLRCRLAASRLASLAAIGSFALLMTLAARASFWLPGQSVPVTMQTLVALLAGGLLGSRLGLLSMLVYLDLGAAGLPVFPGGVPDHLVIIGVTGGYRIGFVVAAYLVGRLTETGHISYLRCLLANLAGCLAILLLGMLWLAAWSAAYTQDGVSAALWSAFRQGVAPFLLIDTAKAIVATNLIRATLVTRTQFGIE